jgi:glycosyltransferase involved in cell wall biosynthesis
LFLLILYFAYPILLGLFRSKDVPEKTISSIDAVTLVYLSFNGRKYIEEKVNFLLNELSEFPRYELIIIDDCSTDGSQIVLDKYKNLKDVKIIQKSIHKGIADSMNLAVSQADYDYLVFCDQRQRLSSHIVKNIIEPLKLKNVGAVSGCLSCLDKNMNESIIRKHENFMKSKESEIGCLIGVYGPFYAIKKRSYVTIPEYIILDDLYLSLNILKNSQIKLDRTCIITDDEFTSLYTYQRTKRYLLGFIQILNDRKLICGLTGKHKLMLFWHKYLRLTFPVLFFATYLSLGFMILNGIQYLLSFLAINILILLSVSSSVFNRKLRFISLIRMNVLYFFALMDIALLSNFKIKKIN